MKQQSPRAEFLENVPGKIDADYSIVIPERFFASLSGASKVDQLIVTPWRRAINIFSPEEWERFETELYESKDPEMQRLLRFIVVGITEVPVSDRRELVLPQSLCEEAGVGGEMIFVMMKTHIRIIRPEDLGGVLERMRG